MEIVFYTRPGCHLCEEAEDLLLELAAGRPLALRRHNILDDPALYERFRYTIPAFACGDLLVEAPVEASALRRLLAQASEI